MSEERERATAADKLLMQLATDPTDLATEGVDLSRLGVIPDDELRSYIWFALRAKVTKSKFYRHLHNISLSHTIGVGGRGRVDTLKAASVAQGGGVNTEADLIKPNWVVRNFIDKNWEHRQRMELGLPPATE